MEQLSSTLLSRLLSTLFPLLLLLLLLSLEVHTVVGQTSDCQADSTWFLPEVHVIEHQAGVVVFNSTKVFSNNNRFGLRFSFNLVDLPRQEEAFLVNFKLPEDGTFQTETPLVVSTRGEFDREAIAGFLGNTFGPLIFNVTIAELVLVSDGLVTRDCVVLVIHVEDIDDNVPTFLSSFVELTFVENDESLTQKGLPLAKDDDEGENGTSSYSLVDDMGIFYVQVNRDPTTNGISSVSLKHSEPLDYEKAPSYTLTLVAAEGIDNGDLAQLEVRIRITPVCDEFPYFETYNYLPAVTEDAANGSTIVTVMAFDNDTGVGGDVIYEVLEVTAWTYPQGRIEDIPLDKSPFVLDRESGTLVLNDALDREKNYFYEVSIRAEDGCSLSATATVGITVEDVNDNAPSINYGGLRGIEESIQLESDIGTVTVTDLDDGTNALSNTVLHELVGGELVESETFLILDQDPPKLKLKRELDRETKEEYHLVFIATDMGNPPLSSRRNLTILVLDVNDNTPIFDFVPPVIELAENTAVNTKVHDFHATDIDAHPYNVTTYDLPPTSAEFPFQHFFQLVSSTGVLLVDGALNREEHEQLFILVTAVDSPAPEDRQRMASIVVNITLLDRNDNGPTISSPGTAQNVSEAAAIGDPVFTVVTDDLDSSPEHRVHTFSLLPSPAPFSIDPNSGEVRVNGTLDRETTDSYDITVEVSDGPHTDRESFTITVTDVNDVPPRFDRVGGYEGSVQENSDEGTSVLRLTAVDDDLQSEPFVFHFQSGEHLNRFSIDAEGVVRTARVLDREETQNYTLFVTVFDGLLYSEESARVFISVLDINDHTPYATGTDDQGQYNFEVDENLPVDTRVGQIMVVSLDLGELQFRFLGGNENGYFRIDRDTGEITTGAVLDREVSFEPIVLNVEFQDLGGNPNPQSVLVNVRVGDRNDEAPQFESATLLNGSTPQELSIPANKSITVYLKDSFSVGAPFLRVVARDADIFPNNVTDYELSADNTQFHIDTIDSTGELSLRKGLDFDREQRHTVDVFAKDHLDGSRLSKLQVIVHVVDVPPPCLKFPDDFSPQQSVEEEVDIGTTVVFFEVTNSDNVPVSGLQYNLTNQDGSESLQFYVMKDPETLEASVATKSAIDRDGVDSPQEYRLNITACDVDTPECTCVSVILTVTIIDVNDIKPHFQRDLYEFSLQENNVVNDIVEPGKIIQAYDEDAGDNGEVELSVQSTPYVPFSVDSNGHLRVLKSLDYEMLQQYEFVVYATDKGNPPKSGSASVIVSLVDKNDNDPEFSTMQLRTFLVSENAEVHSTVAVIEVDDQDSGEYGQVHLHVANIPNNDLDNHFQLKDNGGIILLTSLDRETTDSYSFTVEARDGGIPSRTARAVIDINVTDYNDHQPVFTNRSFTVTIPETLPHGTPFTSLHAVDGDIGTNAAVRYALGDSTFEHIFCVSSLTGIISLCDPVDAVSSKHEVVDYERDTRYEVAIVAYDQGRPRLMQTATLTVIITPVNEHRPQFDAGFLVAYVEEGQPGGTVVAPLEAYDDDYDILEYVFVTLVGPNGHFRWDQESRAVVTTLELSYEANNFYSLRLQASDRDFNRSVELEVFVINVNDHDPVFDPVRSSSLLLSESTMVESVVATVHATDQDNATAAAVVYSIDTTGGNHDNTFTVNPLMGDIVLSRPLDYENRTSFVLSLTAMDTGSPQRTSSVLQLTVEVQNENDHSPKFTSESYSFPLQENQPAGLSVGKVEAIDLDSAPFDDVRFSLSGSGSEMFSIGEESGEIHSGVSLDREEHPGPFSLTVTASDGRHSVSAPVTVTVGDENDNGPVFSKRRFFFHFDKDVSFSDQIMSLSSYVSDPDLGDNADFVFEIASPVGELSINLSLAGILSLGQPLPPISSLQTQYDIDVRTVDPRDRAKFDTAVVQLLVETSTDHHPRFTQEAFQAEPIFENAEPGETVFDLRAHVTDEEDNVASYRVEPNLPEFSLDSERGLLTLNQPLDFEQRESYELTIFATDSTQRTATAFLTITVKDFNDEFPMFVSAFSSITLSPIPYSNVEVFRVSAEDRDATEDAGGTVFYSIVNSEYFEVDIKTGIVCNKGSLSAGLMTSFILRAYDNGAPLKSSNITITVTVTDPGEEAPGFGASLSFPLVLSEVETASPETILQTFASSPGVTYHLVKSSAPEGMFDIVDGELVLVGSLDYEEETKHTMIVESRQEQTDPLRYLSSFGEITLRVLDANDNSPVFAPVSDISLVENRGPGIVFTVEAEDRDSGTMGEVHYNIASGNTGQVFQIDEENGTVSLVGSLDREQTASYELVIRATDGAVPDFKMVEVTITITVDDDNDYVPHFASNFTINVYESPQTRSGDPIGTITATDLDTGPFFYGFRLLSAQHRGKDVPGAEEPISIDLDEGIVMAAIELDREVIDFYLVEVTAWDRKHTATAYLSIHVLDANDHTPVIRIAGSSETTVCEHQPVGSLVTNSISAVDSDSGHNGAVRYRLGEGWPEGWFSINPISGVIRVASDITFVQDPTYFQGIVIAEDLGTPSRSASLELTVRVLDINDHTPRFDQERYEIPVSVNSQHGTILYTFNITDADFGVNNAGLVRIPDYYQVPFNIKSFTESLEQQLPSTELHVGDTYCFEVEVINKKPIPYSPHFILSSYADVKVVVRPVNLHPPTLDRESYLVNLPEDYNISEPVLQLVADDGDGDDVKFTITEPASGVPFHVTLSGSVMIKVGASVDYELQTSYQFSITATDTGFPPQTAVVKIDIQIQDVNEYSPVFEQRSYSVRLHEREAVSGVAVVRVNATDGDAGSTGRVQYSITGGEGLPFTINTQTGVVYTTEALHYDSQPYQFSVVAFNPGLVADGDTADVLVSLTGINVASPVFEQDSYEFVVQADARKGDKIGTVRANDADLGPGGNLSYTILTEEALKYIRIENTPENTGDIYLIAEPVASTQTPSIKRQAGGEDFVTIRTEIQASDRSQNPLTATITTELRLHSSFVRATPTTATPSSSSAPYAIIIVVVVAVVVAVLVFVAIIVTAMTCRARRQSRKEKIVSHSVRNNVGEAGRYTVTNGEVPSGQPQPRHANGYGHHGSTTSIPGSDYGGYAGDEESITRYHARSPGLPRKSPLGRRSFESRSTSDLASTIGTEMLNTSQETGPYTKAQIAAIYAANADLLANNGSQDSVHMFGSEGGGEADGEVDIDNILLSKSYDLDDDDVTTLPEDIPASLGTDSSGNLDVPPVEGHEEPVSFGQDLSEWSPRGGSITEAINELVYTGSSGPSQRRPLYEPAMNTSQDTSMFEGSTQGSLRDSHTNLLHHQPMASQPRHGYYYGDADAHSGRPSRHLPPSLPSHSHRYGSSSALMNHGLERHHMSEFHHYSQDVPYSHSPHMHFIPPRSRTPPSETPTEGTVTPHRALANDYDMAETYSSSTSIASTNCSQRGYPHHMLPSSRRLGLSYHLN